jgi:hypothetical protein
MKFLRHLFESQNYIKKRINVSGEKVGAQNNVNEIQYQKKWLQHVRTWDGHKQNTKTSTAI